MCIKIDIRNETEKINDDLIRLRRHFHKYPELSMKEYKTAEKIRDELDCLGIPYENVGETGIVGTVGQGRHAIALRADMDALQIQEKNECEFVSQNPGIMHACGHDAHMASLLGAAKILKKYEKDLGICIKLVFQPSEENGEGARIIMESGQLSSVKVIFGLHVFSDIPCGIINVEAGERMAAADFFRIRLIGKSGHAGKPHLSRDAAVAGAALLLNLQTIVSREIDPISTAVVTVGHFSAGTQSNIIAGEAVLEGTIRTFSENDTLIVRRAIARISEATSHSYSCRSELEFVGSTNSAVINDASVTEVAESAARKLFPVDSIRKYQKLMLGEDFAVYQKSIPGVFAFVGAGEASQEVVFPNHHERFSIDEQAILNATMLYVGFAVEMSESAFFDR